MLDEIRILPNTLPRAEWRREGLQIPNPRSVATDPLSVRSDAGCPLVFRGCRCSMSALLGRRAPFAKAICGTAGTLRKDAEDCFFEVL